MPASLSLSHFELRARDLARMENFYTRVLGFLVTDRGGAGPGEMVFLSRHPDEHHQIVLAGTAERGPPERRVDHLAFRVATLGDLRQMHEVLEREPDIAAEAVSHGTTWSIYFRDPEENRIELFVDSPWHVDQPVRFPIDLGLPDAELIAWTQDQISALPGFKPKASWHAELARRIAGTDGAGGEPG